MANINFSVVIPARNEEAYIGKTLESIFTTIKDRTDVEVFVVDNGSTDKTKEVVARYPKATLLEEPIPGTSRTRERGFRASHGALVGFLDSDTMLPADWFAKAEAAFKRDPRLVCLSGPYIYYDLPAGINLLVRVFYSIAYGVYVVSRFIFRNASVVQGGNYVVRRTALEAIGGHDVTITFYGDDTDVAKRMSKVGEVKFSFGFPVYSSGRRLAMEGLAKTAVRYAVNYFWIVVFGQPFSSTSNVIRGAVAGTNLNVKKWDWVIGFTILLFMLAVTLAIFYGIYYVLRFGAGGSLFR